MTLKNDILTIEIANQGAELTSLRKGQTEYLWQGNPAYWKRRAPVLFPIVGKVFNNQYRVNGEVYELPQHGFARDKRFQTLYATDTEAALQLTYSDDTLRIYPYKFQLTARYILDGCRLRVKWLVENLGEGNLYYQIGGHPAFLLRDYDASDPVHGYEQLECLTEEDWEPLDALRANKLTPQGYCLNQYRDIRLEDNLLPLTDDTFAHDAIVLENSQAESVTLLDKAQRPYLRLTSIDATVMGLWSPHIPGCPFTCIEPWCGRADREGFDGDITRREHIQACLPSDKEDFGYEIEILD